VCWRRTTTATVLASNLPQGVRRIPGANPNGAQARHR